MTLTQILQKISSIFAKKSELSNYLSLSGGNVSSLTVNGKNVALDSDVVHKSGDETISGFKTFSNSINNKSIQQFIFNKEYTDTTDDWLGIHNYFDKNNARIGFHAIGDFNGRRSFRWFIRGQSTNSSEQDIFGFGRASNETSYLYINGYLDSNLIPIDNSKSLGSSDRKWKTLNGVNIGSLSLPSSNYQSIDTTNWVKSSLPTQIATVNLITDIPFDGWLFVDILNTLPKDTLLLVSADSLGNLDDCMRRNLVTYSANEMTNFIGGYVPVRKGGVCKVALCITNGSGANYYSAKFLQAQGNV